MSGRVVVCAFRGYNHWFEPVEVCIIHITWEYVMRNGEYRLVLVEWTDAEEHGEMGWNDLEEMLEYAAKECPIMRSVGWCVHESASHIALLSTIGDIECSTVEKIPNAFIYRCIALTEDENANDCQTKPCKKGSK